MGNIIVVSGLPRSGTSLMMSMLEAGGLSLLTDEKRNADESNPLGYYEYEKIKRLKSDNTWLHEAEDKVIKVVSTLLDALPGHYHYRVVFMKRNMQEILNSQRQMLQLEGKNPAADDTRLAMYFSSHLQKVEEWLNQQHNFSVCSVSFNALFTKEVGKEMEKLAAVFRSDLFDSKRALSVIESSLYRQRTENSDS